MCHQVYRCCSAPFRTSSNAQLHLRQFSTVHWTCRCSRFSDGAVSDRAGGDDVIRICSIACRIAQLREPYSALRFWAERALPRLHAAYNLQSHAEECGVDPAVAAEQDAISAEGGGEWANGVEPARDGGWSPWALAEAMSVHKKFFSRGGRPDLHRAANFMLHDAMEGMKLPLFFEPPRPGESSLNALGADDERELRELRERQAKRAADTAAAAAAAAAATAVAEPERPMTPRAAAPMSAAERRAKEAQERREQMEEMERYDREMMEEEARLRDS